MTTAGNLSCALLTLQSTVQLHSKKLGTAPHSGFIHFITTRKKTAITSLNTINRLDLQWAPSVFTVRYEMDIYTLVRIASGL